MSKVITGNLYDIRQAWRPVEEVVQYEPVRKPARVALMLALAHKIQQMIDRGVVADQAAAAARLGLTRARVSQLMDLTLLPVKRQEEILFMESVDGIEPVTERGVREADS